MYIKVNYINNQPIIKINYIDQPIYIKTVVDATYIKVDYGGGTVWGQITGTLSDQSDLQSALDAKFDDPTGTISQYIRGDGTLATFPLITGYVPYTGATTNVDLGEYELKAGQLTLDTTPTGTAAVTTTRWNDSVGVTETTLKGGNVILKNGVDLVARVVNKVTPNTTLTKASYQAVKISGAQGQRLAVGLAQANTDANSADTIGLVTETIPTNQEGFIMTVGNLEGVNTTGSLQSETWIDGDVLYLSPSTAGAITNIKPTGATGHIVVVGYVEYAHVNNGKIYVKVMNGWELDELHNVYINSPANSEVLTYESATSLWKNKTIATILGYTPQAAITLTTTGTSGAATLIGSTLNIPQYSGGGGGTGTVTSVSIITANGISGTVATATTTPAITLTLGAITPTSVNSVVISGSTTPTLSVTGTSSISGSNNGDNAVNSLYSGLVSNATHTGDATGATVLTVVGLRGVALPTLGISAGFLRYTGTGTNTWVFDTSTYYLASNPSGYTNNTGTVTSVAALTLGTTGTDLSSSVANGTTTPIITLNVPTASATNRGALSSADWTTFNSKQAALNGTGFVKISGTTISYDNSTYYLASNPSGYTSNVGTVTSVSALTIGTTGTDITSSVATSTTTPVITLNIPTASATNRGALSSADWSTFNGKQGAITLTTTGTSGAATFIGNTLNIPQYSGGGGITRSINNISTATTAAAASTTDYVYLISGTTTLTLPTAVGNTNRYTLKNVGTNIVTINTTSSQTIDGSTSITMSVRYTALDVISDGTNWNIL